MDVLLSYYLGAVAGSAAANPLGGIMHALTAEFCAIVGFGLFVWFRVARGNARHAALLRRIETDLCRVKAIVEEAPWMVIHPEDVSDLLLSDRVRPFMRRRGD